MGETTLVQTIDPRSKIQVPRTLKWFEVTFPPDWTLENENYHLQIQNPAQNPDLDFVQQLADGTIRISFDQCRFRKPLENENYHLQIQNPAQNPDLDFVQQLADGTIRLSFDQCRFRTPLDYDESRIRSPIDLH